MKTKAYTDIEQSKKLAEILPLKSADMRYAPFGDTHPWFMEDSLIEKDSIPCWSLAALIKLLPKCLIHTPNPLHEGYSCLHVETKYETFGDNLIDCCVEMIVELHTKSYYDSRRKRLSA